MPEDDEAATTWSPAGVDLTDSEYYLNRELSELAFQGRVLHEGLDDRNPPLERLRFLAYFTKNTDEFFMKRVGGLKQQIDAGVTERSPDGRTPQEQWEEVVDAARPMFERQAESWQTELKPALSAAGIDFYDHDALSPGQQEELREYFQESIQPTLTPLAFDPAHPFPFISNLSLSLAVLSESQADEGVTFTRIKVPQNQPRLVDVPGEEQSYVLLEDLIEANIDLLLPNIDIRDVSKFRVTRNAEVRRNEEVAEDLIDMIEEVIEQRRFATVVRLEVAEDMPEYSLEILKEQLNLSDREVYRRRGPIDFRDFFDIADLDRPDLKLDEWTPQPHPRLQAERDPFGRQEDEEVNIFEEIQEGDILAHHPYHSFEGTVQRFLEAAAEDPNVLAVKAAIYRTASDSKIIQSLIDAAENGKQVAVMVELKARFDEQNNLEWVRKLEEEGIHVAYGTVGLKTHTKTALVVRREADGVKIYSHVGTGNYHSETAKGYVDLGILTTDRDTGQDLTKVFNFFTGPTLDEQFRKLLIAPVNLRERFTECIRREARRARRGEEARIVVKINGLEDPDIVEELYRASMSGVDIDLIVRDICRLRPGLEGISENVTVHSIVGRFLEHSRIFYFRNGGDPEWYIGSADWMTRNLDHRVEAVTPVESRDIRRQLRFILETQLTDNRRRWLMQSDGTYEQVTPADGEPVRDTQDRLMAATLRAVSRDSDLGIAMDGDGHDHDLDLLVEPVDDEAERADSEPADAEPADNEPAEADTAEAEATVGNDGGEALPPVFQTHDEHWYVPQSNDYDWAVRTRDGKRRYFKSRQGAAQRLREEYE
ncbi:polyphosphate kinase 1 [Haloarchaeobius amylolyticus]|uniref:polyphosphate kinase 1 n=1 Tax=Haloarchaeobius amylolyticus TaxID=1198296 RepID=UPI00227036C9|nr:polyphosphate kinase 1 [Haloarchaeobius amylolyticus]